MPTATLAPAGSNFVQGIAGQPTIMGGSSSAPLVNLAAQQDAQQQLALQQQMANLHNQSTPQVASHPYVTSSGTSSSQSGPGMANLQGLISQIQGMNPVTTQTQTTNQNRSPEMEAQMQQFAQTINGLNAGQTAASQNMAGTYGNAMNALSQMYGNQSSAATQAAQSGALSSGMTPLEASGAGQTAHANALAQYFPQLAALQQGQGQVGVDLQKALQGIQQSLGLPTLGMANSYNQAVAGQTQNTTTNNPMQKMDLLANLTADQAKLSQSQWSQQQNDALGWAKLQADQQYQQGSLANQLQQMIQNGQFNQGQLTNQARGQDIQAQSALQDLLGRQGMANQTNQTAIRGQDLTAQNNQATQGLEQQKLGQQLQAMLMGQGNTDRNYQLEINKFLGEYGAGPLGAQLTQGLQKLKDMRNAEKGGTTSSGTSSSDFVGPMPQSNSQSVLNAFLTSHPLIQGARTYPAPLQPLPPYDPYGLHTYSGTQQQNSLNNPANQVTINDI